jgi:myosin-1
VFERSKATAKKAKADRIRRRRAVESVRIVADVYGVDDMVMLPKLTNKAIVANLTARHKNDVIYTYIGNVLISVNPFKWITMYDDFHVGRYKGKSPSDVPPHVFAVAERAYREMREEEESQCVIISGESGAGKTEAAKQIMRYIAAVSGGRDTAAVERVKDVIMQSNPVLEAFGNAMTLRNNNSSRFGKYLEIQFDTLGRPRGGKITTYLLEKSRVVRPGPGERSFHIFYMLLAGASRDLKQKLFLGGASEFRYLSRTGVTTIDNIGGSMDDRDEWLSMTRAMDAIGLRGRERERLMELVAGVLHLGNVVFRSKRIASADGSEVVDRRALKIAADLLGIDSPDALAKALCFRRMETAGEAFDVPSNPAQAGAARDALAKAIYSSCFDFVVSKVNEALRLDVDAESELLDSFEEDEDDLLTIGVLDIYGFEVFERNSFEQFCINYVNEKLQQIFIELTLKAEQEEYEREGIEWEEIPFFNNKVVCQLIEARRPPGIFTILDDTCKTIHAESGPGVDGKFLDKLKSFHSKHRHFMGRSGKFVVKHYAGDVEYTVEGFCVANKDALRNDLSTLLQASDHGLIAQAFASTGSGNGKKKKKTSGEKIKGQCKALVSKLMECSPHYVRCLKSNDQKRADFVNTARMAHQCKYLGVLENIKVRRAGFAYRAEFHRFVDRFRLLSSETWPGPFRGTDRQAAQAVLVACQREVPELGGEQPEAQLGKRKIFIKRPQTFFRLERLLQLRRHDYATKIQAAWRLYLARREIVEARLAIGALYGDAGKQRSRGSVYRPFDGDYLRRLPEAVREACLAIVEYHGEDEHVCFGDLVRKLEPGDGEVGSDSRDGEIVQRVLVVTNKAIYTMEHMRRGFAAGSDVSDAEAVRAAIAQAEGSRKRRGSTGGGITAAIFGRKVDVRETEALSAAKFKHVHLRRRTELSRVQGVTMSLEADDCLMIRLEPDEERSAPDKSHWIPNSEVAACMQTGRAFGRVLNRRHHCRLTGNQYCDSVCNAVQLLPDLGWYTPQRVHDGAIGFASTEMREDIIILSQRKTEIAAVLYERSNAARAELRSEGRRAGREIDLERFFRFSDSFQARQAPIVEISRTPRGPVEVSRKRSGTGGLTNVEPTADGGWAVRAPSGVPRRYVEARRRRDEKRAQVRQERRQEEQRLRAERAEARAAERAEARAKRIAEKRARKALNKGKKKGARQKKVTESAARSAAAKLKTSTRKTAAPSNARDSEATPAWMKKRREQMLGAEKRVGKSGPPPLSKLSKTKNTSKSSTKPLPIPKPVQKSKPRPAARNAPLSARPLPLVPGSGKKKNQDGKRGAKKQKKGLTLQEALAARANRMQSGIPAKAKKPAAKKANTKESSVTKARARRMSRELLGKALGGAGSSSQTGKGATNRSGNDEASRLDSEIADLKKQQEAAVSAREYRRAAELEDKIKALQERRSTGEGSGNASRIAALEVKLNAALAERDFRKAGDIEDEIKALKKGMKSEPKNPKSKPKPKPKPKLKPKPKPKPKPKQQSRPQPKPMSAFARKQAQLAAAAAAAESSDSGSGWESD